MSLVWLAATCAHLSQSALHPFVQAFSFNMTCGYNHITHTPASLNNAFSSLVLGDLAVRRFGNTHTGRSAGLRSGSLSKPA